MYNIDTPSFVARDGQFFYCHCMHESKMGNKYDILNLVYIPLLEILKLRVVHLYFENVVNISGCKILMLLLSLYSLVRYFCSIPVCREFSDVV